MSTTASIFGTVDGRYAAGTQSFSCVPQKLKKAWFYWVFCRFMPVSTPVLRSAAPGWRRPARLPLSKRKHLDRLCRKSRVPFLRQVQTFPEQCAAVRALHKFGFEGVVSKRLLSRYVSVNSEPYRLFQGPRKSEPKAARKEARGAVLERLRSPGLRRMGHSGGVIAEPKQA